MGIRKQAVIPDLRVYEANGVCREHGRKRRDALAKEGVIKPKRTPTGRCLLSIDDAERLEAAL